MREVIKESITPSSLSLRPSSTPLLISFFPNPFLAPETTPPAFLDILASHATLSSYTSSLLLACSLLGRRARCSVLRGPFFLLTRHKLWHSDNQETAPDISPLTLLETCGFSQASPVILV